MDASQKGKLIYKLAELLERDIDYLAVHDIVVVTSCFLHYLDYLLVDYYSRLKTQSKKRMLK